MAKEAVVVGCKLPHGLIIRVGNERHTIKGANQARTIGGHGITEDVPKDLWFAWYEANKGHSVAIQQELIFAYATRNGAESAAERFCDNVTGFEGIDPKKPGSGIEKAEV